MIPGDSPGLFPSTEPETIADRLRAHGYSVVEVRTAGNKLLDVENKHGHDLGCTTVEQWVRWATARGLWP